MTNNDILRRLRYTFNYGDDQIINIFALGDKITDRTTISAWLKKDEDPELKSLHDNDLAHFLNGFIVLHRGKKDGEVMPAEKQLNNNIILRKLKIALTLKDDDVLELLKLVDFKLSKHELSAFFRKPDHPHYRLCKDQILRNFLMALQKKYRN